MPDNHGKWPDGLVARAGGGFLGAQALLEYGALNTLARDASAALQRLGGWAAQNWMITAAVLGIVIFTALRPKR